jgi:hypothetical protein
VPGVLAQEGRLRPPGRAQAAGREQAADRLLKLVGQHAQEVLAETVALTALARAKVDALPDLPVLNDDLEIIRRMAADVGWVRSFTATALFELAVERERATALERRVKQLEQRLGGRRDGR